MKNQCEKCTNPFGPEIFPNHILPVAEYAKELARLTGADEEIVEIAALLHDIGSIHGDLQDHHISGAGIAEELLTNLNFDKVKIEKIKHCIFAHRGSKDIPFDSVEAECVAGADGMSHIDAVPSLLRLHTEVFGKSTEEAKRHIKKKLHRSWEKLMPEAKELVREKFEAAIGLLD